MDYELRYLANYSLITTFIIARISTDSETRPSSKEFANLKSGGFKSTLTGFRSNLAIQ